MNIALVGNPNSGKTSLFNALTGLNQKVGNFPGVTVDKKTGRFSAHGQSFNVTDLPGIYSLSPRSLDEEVACKVLFDETHNEHPEGVVVVLDAANLKRNLFLCTQVLDLHIPAVVALNMSDVARESGIEINLQALEQWLGVPVVEINAKDKEGIPELKASLKRFTVSEQRFFRRNNAFQPLEEDLKKVLQTKNAYTAFKLGVNAQRLDWVNNREAATALFKSVKVNPKEEELLEITARYKQIETALSEVIKRKAVPSGPKVRTQKLDYWFTHPVIGFALFLFIFFLLFQAVFTIAAYPMDWIDAGFGMLSGWVTDTFEPSILTDFLSNGIIAGIGGIVVFVPQIMILFGLITLLEDTGYMARVSFLNDRLLQKVGMNGRSIVPLVSGFACAIPAIMAARSIDNWKERLITIMVTPLMSCSARLPVYVFLVSFIVPETYYFGLLSLQGLFMLGLYLLGIVLSILVAWVFNKVLKNRHSSTFILELPHYKRPRWGNVWASMFSKGRTFVVEAGKIIFFISILLWILSSYGPADNMDAVRDKYAQLEASSTLPAEQLEAMRNTELLENSYAGIMGKTIEPVIQPLGFNWRIGIAVVTSFAAREVFVGTMSVLYSVEGGTDSIKALKEKMKNNVNPATGAPYMSLPTAASLLIFYVIAMQCMSTLAITKRETNSWKWPLVQLVYLTVLAYTASLITYQLMA